MKKLIAIVLTLTAILSTFAVTASAADNPLTVTVDGTAVAFPDQQPVIKTAELSYPSDL